MKVSEKEMQAARDSVAQDWRENAMDIFNGDPYATHVTKEEKYKALEHGKMTAQEISDGKHDHSFWCWQRINYKLTGEVVGLFPKEVER